VDEKYLFPLFGIALGWALNAISSDAKMRMDKKKTAAKLLSKLIQIESQVRIYESTTESMKALCKSNSAYERFRLGLIERHFLKPNSIEEDLKSAIDEYSQIDPLSATQLESIYQSLIKLKVTSIESSMDSEEIYSSMLKVMEANTASLKVSLLHHIKKAAFKHGFVTYLKVKFTDYKAINTKESKAITSEIIDAVKGMEEVKKSLAKTS